MTYPNTIIYNQNPFGMQFAVNEEENSAFMGRPIAWIREERCLIAKIAVYTLTFFVALALTLSVIGVPVVIFGYWEYIRQEEESRIASIRQRILQAQEKLQNVMGGSEFFTRVPVLDLRGRMGVRNLVNFLEPSYLSQPIVKGSDRYARDFIAIKVRNKDTNEVSVQTLQQRFSDDSVWIASQGPLLAQEQVITDQELDGIKELCENRHPQFAIAT